MKRLHFRALFVSVLALCVGTGHAQQPKQDVKSAILERRAIWNKAIIERDFDTLAGLTTPDSSRIGPAARDSTGRSSTKLSL